MSCYNIIICCVRECGPTRVFCFWINIHSLSPRPKTKFWIQHCGRILHGMPLLEKTFVWWPLLFLKVCTAITVRGIFHTFFVWFTVLNIVFIRCFFLFTFKLRVFFPNARFSLTVNQNTVFFFFWTRPWVIFRIKIGAHKLFTGNLRIRKSPREVSETRPDERGVVSGGDNRLTLKKIVLQNFRKIRAPLNST